MSKKTTAYARKRQIDKLPKGTKITPDAFKGSGIAVFNMNASPLTPHEIDAFMKDSRHALEMARQGRATYNDYGDLSSAMQKGQAIEHRRTIIRGFAPIYESAGAALKAMEARATRNGHWIPPTLYAHEISALDDLIWAYEQALKVCTYREFYKCQNHALGRATSRGERIYSKTEIMEYPA